jgi:Transposase DDE domain
MAQRELTPHLSLLEEAITVLFCRVDDAYYRLNPKGRRYETLKELSDSEVMTLALFQQLRGVESERSFLREVARFFAHLFPGIIGLYPSSFHRRVRKLRSYFEPLRRAILPELVGDPETLIVDSTLLAVLHPREVSQSGGWGSSSAGAAWVRWGTFSVYGVKLHLICATNRVPISYELPPANTAEVCLTEELLAEADLGGEVARKLLADLAYRSQELQEELAESGIMLVTDEASARRPGVRQQIEICISSLKRVLAWARLWPPRSLVWQPGSRRR